MRTAELRLTNSSSSVSVSALSCSFVSCLLGCSTHWPLRMAAYRIALSRNKAFEQDRMFLVDSTESAEEPYTLLTLQNHVLERIFLRLHLTDLARCCQVCKGLQSLVQQDSIWQSLCTAAFPTFTALELKQWINPTVRPSVWQRASEGFRELPPRSPASSSSASLRPTTYRSEKPSLSVSHSHLTHSHMQAALPNPQTAGTTDRHLEA